MIEPEAASNPRLISTIRMNFCRLGRDSFQNVRIGSTTTIISVTMEMILATYNRTVSSPHLGSPVFTFQYRSTGLWHISNLYLLHIFPVGMVDLPASQNHGHRDTHSSCSNHSNRSPCEPPDPAPTREYPQIRHEDREFYQSHDNGVEELDQPTQHLALSIPLRSLIPYMNTPSIPSTEDTSGAKNDKRRLQRYILVSSLLFCVRHQGSIPLTYAANINQSSAPKNLRIAIRTHNLKARITVTITINMEVRISKAGP